MTNQIASNRPPWLTSLLSGNSKTRLTLIVFTSVYLQLSPIFQGVAGEVPESVWFAPLDPIVRPEVGYGGSIDFFDLFEPNASWSTAASGINVFKLYPQVLVHASDQQLQTVIANLKQRHIAMAIEFPLLQRTETCGHSEGYGDSQAWVAERIRRLGGELSYVDADEPLYFGHSAKVRNGCAYTVDELAKRVAQTALAFRQVFPHVRFVDTEPISNFDDLHWEILVTQFNDAFRHYFEDSFYEFHVDVNWASDWEPSARKLALLRGIRLGVICNGNPNDSSDKMWLEDARTHCLQVTRLLGRTPDTVVFQSWARHPSRLLPETSSDTFTLLIRTFVIKSSDWVTPKSSSSGR